MKLNKYMLGVAATAALASGAHAATMSLTAIEDTFTQQLLPTTNSSTDATFSFGAAGGGQARSMLYRFDTSSLTGIPAADIISVTLQLTLASNTGERTGFVGTLVDANANWTNSGATWDTKDGTNAWILAGARGASDSELLEDNFLVASGDTAGKVFSITLSVAGTSYANFAELFAEWNDGTNNGLVTYNAPWEGPGRVGGVASGVQTFHSSEATNAAFRPQLIIETVPEPSTTVLLGLGGFALILRRKK